MPQPITPTHSTHIHISNTTNLQFLEKDLQASGSISKHRYIEVKIYQPGASPYIDRPSGTTAWKLEPTWIV